MSTELPLVYVLKLADDYVEERAPHLHGIERAMARSEALRNPDFLETLKEEDRNQKGFQNLITILSPYL